MRARWRSAAIRRVEHPTLTLHWSRQAVNFGETDADSVVLSSYNHRVIARRQARPNRRLEWIGWCEIGGSDPRSLIGVRLPVVVRVKQCVVTVIQFQSWIRQNGADSVLRQRRPNRTDDNLGGADVIADNKSANHRIVARSDEGAATDVFQL